MPDNPRPDFPMVRGAERLNDGERDAIAEKAWAQSHGSPKAFQQLCAEHVRGEIDLHSENPNIRIRGQAQQLGVGSDRYTATGGETAPGFVADRPGETVAAADAGATLALDARPGGGTNQPAGGQDQGQGQSDGGQP